MSIHQSSRSGKWYVKWRDPKTRKQRSKWFKIGEIGSQAHLEALAFENELKALSLLGKKLPSKPEAIKGLTIEELGTHYINHRRAAGKSSNWLKDWQNILKEHINPILEEIPVDKLEYSDMLRVVDYYNNRQVSPNTINRYLSYLKAMFHFGIQYELSENNPLKNWRKRREAPKQCLLTLTDLRSIQKHAPEHLAWAIEVAFNLVVRVGPSELTSLTWERVNWEKKGVWVYMSKTNREKFVPCTDVFMEKLKARQQISKTGFIIEYKERPVKSIRKAWKGSVKRAGIPYHTTPYDIRHLAITELLTRGVDPGAVADIAGHANPFFTITRYHHVREGAKRQAIDSLPEL